MGTFQQYTKHRYFATIEQKQVLCYNTAIMGTLPTIYQTQVLCYNIPKTSPNQKQLQRPKFCCLILKFKIACQKCSLLSCISYSFKGICLKSGYVFSGIYNSFHVGIHSSTRVSVHLQQPGSVRESHACRLQHHSLGTSAYPYDIQRDYLQVT